MKTETCKLYSGDFWIFLPKIIKIDLYNSELYRFKVGAFFETQCSKQALTTVYILYFSVNSPWIHAVLRV